MSRPRAAQHLPPPSPRGERPHHQAGDRGEQREAGGRSQVECPEDHARGCERQDRAGHPGPVTDRHTQPPHLAEEPNLERTASGEQRPGHSHNDPPAMASGRVAAIPNRSAFWTSPTATSPPKYDRITVPSWSDSTTLRVYRAKGDARPSISQARPRRGRCPRTPATRR